MMDYREILRLRSLGFSQRQLEREKIVGREKSKEIFQAADRAGICWPLDDDITNQELELLLFPGKYSAVGMYVEPDYPYIHRELVKHGVTLTLLWEEYCRKCHESGRLRINPPSLVRNVVDGRKPRRLPCASSISPVTQWKWIGPEIPSPYMIR